MTVTRLLVSFRPLEQHYLGEKQTEIVPCLTDGG